MDARKITKFIVLPVLLFGGLAWALYSMKESEQKRDAFKIQVAKTHTGKVISICQKLVSEALNVDAYMADFTKCTAELESNYPERTDSR